MNPCDGIILALLLLAAAWDACVVVRRGLESGETLSWRLYTWSRSRPEVAFLSGVAACWLASGSSCRPLAFALCAVCGHVFGTMKGA